MFIKMFNLKFMENDHQKKNGSVIISFDFNYVSKKA